MFSNIGSKIKGFAKLLFWIFVIICSIAGLVTMYQGFRSNSPLGGIIGGLLIIGAGILLGWLQNFLLYGYGELIDCSQKILRILEERDMDRIARVENNPPAPPVVSQPQPQQSVPEQTVPPTPEQPATPLNSVVDQSVEAIIEE